MLLKTGTVSNCPGKDALLEVGILPGAVGGNSLSDGKIGNKGSMG